MRFRLIVFTIFASMVCAPALGCTCVSPPPDAKTDRDLAQWYVNEGDAIFQGTVRRIELKSALMEAKAGDLFSTDIDQGTPVLQVTFDISRSYRGSEQKNAVITTGVGGGDCGFDFEIGKQYLVYAYADSSGELSTGICSGTGALEESQSNLSYLRGEQTVPDSSKQAARVPTTKLCGHIVARGLELADSQVFLLRIGSKSPIPSDEAEPDQDGSFCISGTKPGNYYLGFMNRAEESPTSFVFFPGVARSSEATAIELSSGGSIPNLVFNVPPQPTFAVRGSVATSNKSAVPAECKVVLLNADPLSFMESYTQEVTPSGSFEFPEVLPGKYWAIVTIDSDVGTNWLTRKVEVEVEAAVSQLSLELVQK